ncbi:MAG TPA: hypothetical protein VIK76_15650, partial [Pyrinomonadaceae bacterium]
GPLRTLVSVLEPVKEYRRYDQRPQTMLSPLTGVVDATTPDSEAARRFAWMVDAFLADAPRFQLYRAEISEALADWQTSGATLDPLIGRSPSLKEVKPLAANLSVLGETGLEAVSYLKLGLASTPEWRTAAQLKMDEAAKPYGALEFMVVPSVRKLIVATGGK